MDLWALSPVVSGLGVLGWHEDLSQHPWWPCCSGFQICGFTARGVLRSLAPSLLLRTIVMDTTCYCPVFVIIATAVICAV